MTDPETSAAVEDLTRRIQFRDEAIRDGEDYPDAEVLAAEYLTALRGRGWRPTPAKVWPAWKPGSSGTGNEPPADLLAGLRADLDAKAAAFRTAADKAAIEDGAA